ncbi:hypothetical protein ACJX0J_027125, partial [Zea mays]
MTHLTETISLAVGLKDIVATIFLENEHRNVELDHIEVPATWIWLQDIVGGNRIRIFNTFFGIFSSAHSIGTILQQRETITLI